MSVEPEHISPGQHYLTRTGEVRRVIDIAQGRVQFAQRTKRYNRMGWAWHPGILDLTTFATLVERVVESDWMPEHDP